MDEVRTRKYLRWFEVLDTDRDRLLAKPDLGLAADRLLAAHRVSLDSDQGRRTRAVAEGFWTHFIAPKDGTGEQRIDEATFLVSVEKRVMSDRIAAGAKLAPIADAYFAVADTDGDGTIDDAGFTRMLAALGDVPDPDCAPLFEHLDNDHDGTIGPEEWRHAFYGFFLSPDPKCPANMLMGAL
ncbi:hypothetical protein [Streptomyces sp. GC420]|uniref:hypothetical protein n=1 Tax=Streptomyces sp. GC420 TaxID=2697568 RepID=UPI001414FB86|nr:hypothetical protein [Streptomyces sp. GC420]NBM19860.1 hypothetical protein [Streptomyces sp. GC420]